MEGGKGISRRKSYYIRSGGHPRTTPPLPHARRRPKILPMRDPSAPQSAHQTLFAAYLTTFLNLAMWSRFQFSYLGYSTASDTAFRASCCTLRSVDGVGVWLTKPAILDACESLYREGNCLDPTRKASHFSIVYSQRVHPPTLSASMYYAQYCSSGVVFSAPLLMRSLPMRDTSLAKDSI